MAEKDIWDRFEVQLSANTIRNLQDPQKVFKEELTLQNKDETESHSTKRPRTCLLLDKMAGNAIKIQITVYNLDLKDDKTAKSNLNVTEKEKSVELSDVKPSCVSGEPAKAKMEEMAMQTDQKEEKTQQQQTEINLGQDMSMQTEKKSEKTQQQQTEKQTGKNQQQQTLKLEHKDCHIQTHSKSFKDSQSQTENKSFKDCQAQTQIKLFKDSHFQTIIKSFINTECQTLSTPIVEQDCQTDSPDLVLTPVQTDMSIANQNDNGCQASVAMHHSTNQTENDTSEQEIQATVDTAHSLCQTSIQVKARSAQTVNYTKTMVAQTDLCMLHSADQECQVGAENCNQDSQTVVSLAFMEDYGVQASVENREICQQTEVNEVQTRLIQTDYLGVFVETQTVPDVHNRECQTDEVIITLPSTDFVEKESVEPPQLLNDGGGLQEDIPAVVAPVDEGNVSGIGEPLNTTTNQVLAGHLSENGTQTDPVTIIIGDASFLIEKLKSSTAQIPSTPGREIEVKSGRKSDIKENGGSLNPRNTPVNKTRPPGRSPRTAPVYRTDKMTSPHGVSPRQQHVVGNRQPHVVQQPNYGNPLSCPFCDLTFHESPALYEHITMSHNEAAMQGHKKPRGREGKTIEHRARGPVVNPPYLVPQPLPARPGHVVEHRMMPVVQDQIIENQMCDYYDGPPVLEPVYNTYPQMPVQQMSSAPPKKKRTYTRREEHVIQEPGLFEDLPSPARAYPRNRIRREIEPEEDNSVLYHQLDAYEYECPHCPEKYGSASHLYTHLKRSHKEDMETVKQEEPKPSDNEQQQAEQKAEQKDQTETEELVQNISQPPQTEEKSGDSEVEDELTHGDTQVDDQKVYEESVEQEEAKDENTSPRKRKRTSETGVLTKKQKIHGEEEEDIQEETEDQVEEEVVEGAEIQEEQEQLEEEQEESEIGTEDEAVVEQQVSNPTEEAAVENEEDLPTLQSPRRLKTKTEKTIASTKPVRNRKPTAKVMSSSKIPAPHSTRQSSRRSKKT